MTGAARHPHITAPKERAWELYHYKGMNSTQLAERFGVSTRTALRWVREQEKKWGKIRDSRG